jgi:hypothetical protein
MKHLLDEASLRLHERFRMMQQTAMSARPHRPAVLSATSSAPMMGAEDETASTAPPSYEEVTAAADQAA